MSLVCKKTLSAVAAAAGLAACGGGGDGGANFTVGGGSVNNQTGIISLGISDAPVEDLKQVNIVVDSIRLQKEGESDVVIETFTSSDLGITDQETFTIDLLEYQGGEQAIVIENLEVTSGEYSNIRLEILDENSNFSNVLTQLDETKELNIPSDELQLGGFTVDADGTQTFTIEFNLRQAMVYRPGPDDYMIKPRGIYVLDNSTASSLQGEINDITLFDTEAPCNAKSDPTTGNVVYLYQGHELVVDNLADTFDPDTSTTDIPANAIEPYASETVTDSTGYEFGFLPSGNYTLVFSCDAANDDPEDFDGLSLPFPEDQIIELTFTAGAGVVCDLPITAGACN